MKMSAQVAPCAAALTAPFARIPCGPFAPPNPHNIAESCLHFICKIHQTLLYCNSVVQQKSRCNRCADQQRALLLLLLTCAQVPHVAKTGQRRCGCRACHRLASAIALQKAGVRARARACPQCRGRVRTGVPQGRTVPQPAEAMKRHEDGSGQAPHRGALHPNRPRSLRATGLTKPDRPPIREVRPQRENSSARSEV